MNTLNHFFRAISHKEIYAALLCTLQSQSAALCLAHPVGVLSICWGVYIYFFTYIWYRIQTKKLFKFISLYFLIFIYILFYLLFIFFYCRSSRTFHLFSHFSTHSFILKGYTAVSYACIHGQFACSTFLHAANIFSGEHSNIFYIYPRPFIMHLLLLQPHLPPCFLLLYCCRSQFLRTCIFYACHAHLTRCSLTLFCLCS